MYISADVPREIALLLLGDFRAVSDMEKDFPKLMSILEKPWGKHFNFAHFSGSAISQADIDLVEMGFSGISIHIDGKYPTLRVIVTAGLKKEEIEAVRVKLPEIIGEFYTGEFNTSEPVEGVLSLYRKDMQFFVIELPKDLRHYRSLPSFRGEIELADRLRYTERKDEKRKFEIGITLTEKRDNFFVTVRMWVGEKMLRPGEKLAREIAKQIPRFNTYLFAEEGEKFSHDSWEWNKGDPRYLTQKERDKIKDLEQATKPYKDMANLYIDKEGIPRAAMGASHIYGRIEDLWSSGITDARILVPMGIVLGHQASVAMFETMMPGSMQPLSGSIYEQCAKDARELFNWCIDLRIGVAKGDPEPYKEKLPREAEAALSIWMIALTRIHEAWPDRAKMKEVHDLFSKGKWDEILDLPEMDIQQSYELALAKND